MAQNLIWTEGRRILIGTFVLSVILLYATLIIPEKYSYAHALIMCISFLLLLFLLFSVYFFRNPDRFCPEAKYDPQILICPADGKIIDITVCNGMQKISIFLSPLDVHVNWMPIAGVIQEI